MQYVQKYLDKLQIPKINNSAISNGYKNKTIFFLYCNYYSFYSQKVLMALYEKNIEFEPLVIDITKGEQYSPWFLEINPRGEIPVLKVNDTVIPDSTRILDYLELYLDQETTPLLEVSEDSKLCGSPKLPFILPIREVLKSGDLSSSKNLRKLAEQNPNAERVLLYKAEIQDRKHEILTNEEEYLKVLNIVDEVLEKVEIQLKEQNEDNWLCSEKFSIADINLAVLLQRLWELGLEDRFWTGGKRPYIDHYFSRVKQRESFKKTIPNLPVHLKMIITTQPPAYVGAAGAVSIGVVLVIAYVFKKLIF
ncbi:unnamed protein product, partial [Brenthis ino]